ncbi:pseudouridine synthase [Alistipes finegoldii]|uniref:pseudouridine synthase n=1 Tax=Alistipes finegoldii TaxID=214856 RepID=UPI0026747118|nr:pseudouridine synthase [Alistipes finegoldii]
MKDFKNDSTSVLTRFGRDKRQRTVTATAERVERRPRLQRDAADSEQPSDDRKPVKRASYNPHFTEDNRPAFDKPRRSFGDKPRGEKPAYGDNRGPKKFGDRKFGDKPYGERKSGDKPAGDRRFADKKSGDRRFGDKPAGDRRFADKKSGDRRFGDKPYKPGFRKHDDKPASYPKFTPEKQIGEMRLNRFLAQSGLCSRREADDFITAGLVTVNGQIVTQLGTKVLPTDEVKFNDSRVQGEKKVYLVLNKPKGYVTSLDDPHAGKTVMELVQGACTERIYPVGRLDKNSLGLLLFTNDGDLTKQLTHPAFRKKKIYQVSLDKPLTRADMDRIAEGITLEDGEIFADEISYVKDNKQEVGIEIHSGRNRIVRRIFEFLGYTVTKLDRVYYAGLTKKNLKRGAWRFLSREEVERLKSGQYE